MAAVYRCLPKEIICELGFVVFCGFCLQCKEVHKKTKKRIICAEMVYSIQDLVRQFPTATCESKWNTKEALDFAPHYAMRLAIGATVTPSPGGVDGVTLIGINDHDYILQDADYKLAKRLRDDLESSFLRRRGYPDAGGYNHFANNLDLILQGIRFMYHRVHVLLGLKDSDIRIGWLNQDRGGCGFFRCKLPIEFLSSYPNIHVDELLSLSYQTSAFYDVFVFHRIPTPQTVAIIQKLKLEGKVIVYECDDDLFNVPNWSPAHKHISDVDKHRALTCIQLADYAFTTTTYIAEDMADKRTNGDGTTHVCKNLIDDGFYEEYKPNYDKQPDERLIGKKLGERAGKICLIDKKTNKHNESIGWLTECDPINIVWFGSNTHDKDLEQVIKAIEEIIEEFDMAVQFQFFGYCPTEFMDVLIKQGNTDPRFTVKEKFSHALHFVQPVNHEFFGKALSGMRPDIGLCPLYDCDFNRAKSALKMLEFAAMGVPVIASNVGPYRELMNEAESWNEKPIALRVYSDRAETDWKANLRSLIKDNILRCEIGNAAKKFVNERYSWNNPNSEHLHEWIQFFDSVINDAKKRRKTADDRSAGGLDAIRQED